MAKDIRLDFDNKTLVDEYISGKDRILQQLKIAVRIWYRHWKWSTKYGVDYQNQLKNKNILSQHIREMIAQVDGVQAILSLEANESFESSGKGMITVDAIIRLDGETIRLEGEEISEPSPIPEFDNYYLVTHDGLTLIDHLGNSFVWS